MTILHTASLLLTFGIVGVIAKNSYMFITPKTIRPGMSLVLQGSIIANHSTPVTVIASLINKRGRFSGGRVIASDTKIYVGTEAAELTIKIPRSLSQGDYKVVVEGRGGLTFKNSTNVSYKSKSSSILIQMDKAIYKPGSPVRFRVLSVYPDLKINYGKMNIDVFDPKGNKIRQWRGVQDPSGVYENEMLMSDQPVLGEWKLKVKMNKVKETKKFTVAAYVLPRFEVSIDLPPYALTTATVFKGTVTAKYTFGKPVKGKLSLRIKRKYSGPVWDEGVWKQPEVINISMPITGEATFTVPVRDIKKIDKYLDYSWFVVEANVTEGLTGFKMYDSEEVQFFSEPLKMIFPSSLPKVFKPGMMYTAYLKVSQQDGTPPADVQKKVKVTITYWIEKKKKRLSITPTTPRPRQKDYDMKTRLKILRPMLESRVTAEPFPSFPFPPLRREKRKKLDPQFYSVPADGVISIPIEVPDNVSRIAIDAKYDERASAYLSLQKSHSPSKSYIQINLLTEYPVAGQPAEFLITSTGSAPAVFYQIVSKGNVVTSGKLNFDEKLKHKISIPMDSHMAPKAKMVVYYVKPSGEVVADGLSFNVDGIFENQVTVAFSDEVTKPGQNISLKLTAEPGSQINVLAVDKSVLLIKSGNDITQNQVKNELQTYDPKDNLDEGDVWFWRWPVPTGGQDAKDVFDNAGLAVLTDAFVFEHTERLNPNDERRQKLIGLGGFTGGRSAYRVATKIAERPKSRDDMATVERVRKVFPETWLWTKAHLNQKGNGTITIRETVPDTITSWVASAFAVHPKSGLGVADQTANLRTFLPFFLNVQLPYSVMRGERVIVQANLFNYRNFSVFSYVFIKFSKEFENVHIDAWGTNVFSSTVARYVMIPANNQVAVYFPVVPKAIGKLKVEIHALTLLSSDAVVRTLLVEPEGVPVSFNKPILVNLKTGSSNYDTALPVAFPKTAVPDSPRIRATVIGDVMGPSLNNLDSLLKMPYGCGEQNMLNFAPNIYLTKYMEATENINPKLKDKAKQFMYKGYQRQLTYQHQDGSFSAFGDRDRQGSMWLTSFVLKTFVQARPFIFVDREVIHKAVDWILKHQNNNGTFQEPGRVLHKEMQGGTATGERSLTSYVVIALLEAKKVKGISRKIDWATNKALAFLEGEIPRIAEVYEVAIMSYALQLANSPKSPEALDILNATAIVEDGEKYWTKDKASKEATKKEYQPWETPHKGKALSIEMTAYALLTLSLTKDVVNGIMVLKWMAGQRNPSGGFVSTQDTVMALQALSEMATLVYSADLDITVRLEGPPKSKFSTVIEVNHTTSLILHIIEIPSDIGEVIISAQGRGLCLVEIAAFYNTEADGLLKPFKMKVTLPAEDSNSFSVKVCARWTRDGTSSMAVLEIGTPSGFSADTRNVRIDGPLARVEDGDRRIVMYFDEIGPKEVCTTVKMQRIGLVAGAQPVPVKLFDYYEPSNVVTEFYVPDVVKNSQVCDVCGVECDFCESPKWKFK